MSYTVLVCGSRNWTNIEDIYNALYGMPKDTVIVNGACRGADNISKYVAQALHLECREYPANWDLHGKAAGPIRNQEMLNKEKPHLVIAFHPNIKKSKGTRDMCKRAKTQNIPVILITG